MGLAPRAAIAIAVCTYQASGFMLPSSTSSSTSKNLSFTFPQLGSSKTSFSPTTHHRKILYATATSSSMEEDITTTSSSTTASASDSTSHEKIPAIDEILDLDNNPLPPSYFEQKMNIPHVEYYTCPQKDAFSGFMSLACRVYLFPTKQSTFYKSIIFNNLSHAREKQKTSPYKLLRDAKSYAVVANFLNSKACSMARDVTGVHIPKQYDAILRPNYDNPIESKFSFLHEDFAPQDGWYQQWLLHDEEECKAALLTFAKLHAYFWHGSNFWNDDEAAQDLKEAVWKSGSYVQPTAQILDGKCSCTKVATEWKVKRMKFKNELSQFDYWDNLGSRLELVAKQCGKLAHPFADDDLLDDEKKDIVSDVDYRKYRTFTHGDPKQANLFFRRDNKSGLEVGLIDFQVSSRINMWVDAILDSCIVHMTWFIPILTTCPSPFICDHLVIILRGIINLQWSGFGLAATDIAHFITSGVHADRLVDGGEKDLLQYYFNELQTHLVKYGAYSTIEEAMEKYSYDTFMEQYDTGVLDICRLIIAYTWARFEYAVEKEDEDLCAKTMNKTSYNKVSE